MAVSSARVTVSTSAVALNTEGGAVGGTRMIVTNADGSNTVDLGDSTVSSGSGYTLGAGATITVELTHGEQLHAIRNDGADVVVHVLRTGD